MVDRSSRSPSLERLFERRPSFTRPPIRSAQSPKMTEDEAVMLTSPFLRYRTRYTYASSQCYNSDAPEGWEVPNMANNHLEFESPSEVQFVPSHLSSPSIMHQIWLSIVWFCSTVVFLSKRVLIDGPTNVLLLIYDLFEQLSFSARSMLFTSSHSVSTGKRSISAGDSLPVRFLHTVTNWTKFIATKTMLLFYVVYELIIYSAQSVYDLVSNVGSSLKSTTFSASSDFLSILYRMLTMIRTGLVSLARMTASILYFPVTAMYKGYYYLRSFTTSSSSRNVVSRGRVKRVSYSSDEVIKTFHTGATPASLNAENDDDGILSRNVKSGRKPRSRYSLRSRQVIGESTDTEDEGFSEKRFSPILTSTPKIAQQSMYATYSPRAHSVATYLGRVASTLVAGVYWLLVNILTVVMWPLQLVKTSFNSISHWVGSRFGGIKDVISSDVLGSVPSFIGETASQLTQHSFSAVHYVAAFFSTIFGGVRSVGGFLASKTKRHSSHLWWLLPLLLLLLLLLAGPNKQRDLVKEVTKLKESAREMVANVWTSSKSNEAVSEPELDENVHAKGMNSIYDEYWTRGRFSVYGAVNRVAAGISNFFYAIWTVVKSSFYLVKGLVSGAWDTVATGLADMGARAYVPVKGLNSIYDEYWTRGRLSVYGGLDRLSAGISNFFYAIWALFKSFFSLFFGLVTGAWDAVATRFAYYGASGYTFVQGLSSVYDDYWIHGKSSIYNVFSQLFNTVVNCFHTIWDFIKSFFVFVFGSASGAYETVSTRCVYFGSRCYQQFIIFVNFISSRLSSISSSDVILPISSVSHLSTYVPTVKRMNAAGAWFWSTITNATLPLVNWTVHQKRENPVPVEVRPVKVVETIPTSPSPPPIVVVNNPPAPTIDQEKLVREITEKVHAEMDLKMKSFEQSYQKIFEEMSAKQVSAEVDYSQLEVLIRQAIYQYDSDKTGMFDYALESAGASVVSIRCSENYDSYSRLEKIWNIPLWYSSYGPRTVIQRNSKSLFPGECWSFKSGTGYLTIDLSHEINITSISYEHIGPDQAPDGNRASAPKTFKFWAYQSENDLATRFLLGSFEYKLDGHPLQFFVIKDQPNYPVKLVEMEITSNYGAEFTCLYRLRVHGSNYKTS